MLQLMNPAEFTLPEVMYFNVGTLENPIMQAFTSEPNPIQQVLAEPEIDVMEISNTENSVDKDQNAPILSAAQIAGGNQVNVRKESEASQNQVVQTTTNSMFSPNTSSMAKQLMLEEKARKALAEKEKIISRRKKVTPVRFKRHSKILANQLMSAQQALDLDEEYETVSETGDSPPKSKATEEKFGGAKPKANFQFIAQQQNYVKDILSQAVSTSKQLPQIPLTIKPSTGIPTPPRCPKGADNMQLIPASTSAFTSRKPNSLSPRGGKRL